MQQEIPESNFFFFSHWNRGDMMGTEYPASQYIQEELKIIKKTFSLDLIIGENFDRRI